ncbi:11123_t:CDS:2 [Entrophospora sp. SA101]|nr:11123_t:CDS:2 [Entrophospora sp. SA101]
MQNRPESLATRVWEAVENDNTSENKKFLGITPQKIRLPETSYTGYGGRTILVKDVPPYARNLPEMFYRYSPKSWADAKKYQLQVRLSNHVLNLLRQQGYRVIYNRQWYVMLKWIQNPELYIDNKYPPFIRIE